MKSCISDNIVFMIQYCIEENFAFVYSRFARKSYFTI